MRRAFGITLLLAYLAFLLGITLGGFYSVETTRNFVPFRMMAHDIRAGGSEFRINFVGNLVAFWPMGILIPAILGPRRGLARVFWSSLGFSLLIETLQGISGRRVADVDDVILNTLGGLMGYGIWRACLGVFARFQKA